MKFLLVSHTFAPELNGVARVVTLLAESLHAQGHEVTVATQFSEQRKTNHWKGIEIEQFKITGNDINGINGEVKRYQDFIKNRNWDIQHHHACQIWGFDLLIDWFKHKNRKVFVTPHGFSQHNNLTWRPYFEKIAKITPFIDGFSHLSESSIEKTYLEKSGAKNLQHIPNGVDLEEFRLARTEPIALPITNRQHKFWALNVSNHVRTKGHKTLHRLARKFPDIGFINIGQPVAIEKWGLNRLSLKLPCYYDCLLKEKLIQNYATIQLSRPQTILAYQQADTFVMPSTLEAAPLVILEAMAAGLPWVAFDVGNVRELKGGIVVKDEQEMEQIIQELKQNPEKRLKLSQEGRAEAVRKYDWRMVFEQYLRLYKM